MVGVLRPEIMHGSGPLKLLAWWNSYNQNRQDDKWVCRIQTLGGFSPKVYSCA